MSELWTETIRIGAGISTPLGFIGFSVALVALLTWLYWRHRARLLAQLPPELREKAADDRVSRYDVSGQDLTKEQRYNLIKAEMERPAKNARFFGVLVLVFVIIAVLLARHEGDVPAPEVFPTNSYETYADPGLSVPIFGNITDDTARSRAWMENQEEGACHKLNLTRDQAALWWVLTDAFPAPHGKFKAFLNVGTDADSVVVMYLVEENSGEYSFKNLGQVGAQGPAAEYVFQVNSSAKHDRLLAFVAMPNAVYDALSRNTKIMIRSQPLAY